MPEISDMVYVVMWHDRHAEPTADVFASPVSAIKWAMDRARESARRPEDLDETLTELMQRAGWLYHASYSCEGDSIWVLPRTLHLNEVTD